MASEEQQFCQWNLCVYYECVCNFQPDNFNLFMHKSSHSLLFVLHCSCTRTNRSSVLCQKQLFVAWWRSHFSSYFIILLLTNYKLEQFIYSNHRGSAVLLGTLHGNVKCKEESCSLIGLVFPMHRLPALRMHGRTHTSLILPTCVY